MLKWKAQSSIQGKIWQTLIDKKELAAMEEKYKVVASRFTTGKLLLKVFADTAPSAEFSISEPQLEDFYFAHIKNLI